MLFKGKKYYRSLAFVLAGLIIGLAVSSLFSYPPDIHAQSAKISQESVDFLTKTGKAMAEVTAAVKPSIVNISTTRTIKGHGGDPFFDDPFFRRFFGDQFGKQKKPSERKSAGLGSGVIVSSDGYIITNYHVVKDADADGIKVLLHNKKEYNGKVIGSDPKTEIAVVKIDARDLPTISWGDSDKLQVGEVVLAVGNPYGLNQTVTMGIVSALGRANVGIADYEDFIQTDAAINPGNSGGALVNVKGELVGINTAIFSTTGGYQGIGFAIPSNMVKSVMESLTKKGKVVRGWLGVSIQQLTPELAKQFKLTEDKGTLINDVVENSPAEKAGMKRGDIILEYNGKKTEEPYILRNMVANTLPGEEHIVKIMRDNKIMTLKVVIGELPSDLQQAMTGEYTNVMKGVGVQDVTAEIAAKLRIPEKIKGVVVNDIDESSAAAGVLLQGDVIQEINRVKITDVKNYQEVVAKIKDDESVLLLIYRGGSSLFITLSNR